MQRLANLRVATLIASAFVTSVSFAQATRPTDAASYCAKLKSIPGISEYASNIISAAKTIGTIAKEDPEKAKEFIKLYSRGADDARGTLGKQLLERINKAVPKKDAYNQDAVLANYMAWFASCASQLRTEKGLQPESVVFLNPLSQEINKFYSAPADQRASTLNQIMGPSGLGELHTRSIENATGLTFAGINPRWVLPVAIAMEGSENLLPPYFKQAADNASALAKSGAISLEEKRSVASGNNPICQRIESSESVQKFISAVKTAHNAKNDSDQSGAIASLLFDNKQGELTALIKRRVLEATDKSDRFAQNKGINQFNKIIESCAAKNIDSDLYLFFAVSPTIPSRIQEQRESFKRNPQSLLNYDGKTPRSIDSINSRWASFYLFMFDDAEEVAARYGKDNSLQMIALSNDLVKKRAEQEAATEAEKYAGLRNLYAFSQTPALAPIYTKCVDSEKIYQGKIADQLQVSAKDANTVAQQKSYLEAAEFRRKNINEVAAGMCLYRLNYGLVMIETNNPGIAMMLAADTKDLKRDNPAEKYTPKAMPEIAKYMAMSPSKFNEDVLGKYLQDAEKQLNQTRTYTRKQQEELRASKTVIGLANAAVEESIMLSLISPMLNGKHLPK